MQLLQNLQNKQKAVYATVKFFWKGMVLIMLFNGLFFLPAFAQEIIKGQVIDESGSPIMGATIILKGGNQGTVTDYDGNFTLEAKKNETLLVRFVGYLQREVLVGDKTYLSIVLKEDTQTLEEIVVIAFGAQKKVNLTGAVGTATAAEIESRPVISTAQALQGVIPGLQIMQNSGSMEKTPSINIRGTGTIAGTSKDSPLVLIDGTEGDLNTLNPLDVENISVLKDASASSIYGSRAAFGVILVTTKSGKVGKMSVTYTNNFRWGSPTVKMKTVDSYTFVNYFNQANRNTNNSTSNVFSDETVQNILDFKTGLIDGPIPLPESGTQWQNVMLTSYADTDWYDVFYKNQNFAQEHNLNASGGTDKLRYYLSLNYMNQDGLLKLGKEYLQRFNVMSKISSQLTEWAKLNYSLRFIEDQYTKPSAMNDGLYENLGRQNWPNMSLYDNNGYLIGGSSPGRDFLQGGEYDKTGDKIYQQVSLELEFIKDWITTTEFSYNRHSEDTQAAYLKTYDSDINGHPLNLDLKNNRISKYRYKENYMNSTIHTRYSTSIQDVHNISIMLGTQIEDLHQQQYGLQKYGLIFESLPELDLATGIMASGDVQAPDMSGSSASWSTIGVFSRVNYDYQGRLLFEGNLRYDGTSRFRQDKRWAWFPSFSFGWNLAREDFWKSMEHIVGTLKIRGSYGSLGNTNTNSWYPTYLTMTISQNSGAWIQDGMRPTIVNTPSPISSDLTWEKVRSWNMGVDWGVMANRLSGSFDLYERYTLNMLGPSSKLPSVYGATVPRRNDTSLKTYGWELEVTWNDRLLSNDLGYGVRFVLSDAQTVVLEYPSNETNSLGTYIAGRKLGEIWGYETIGIAQSVDEMNSHLDQLDVTYTILNGISPNSARSGQAAVGINDGAVTASGWSAGDIMYRDLNGDGLINSGAYTLDDPGDLKVIGNSTPRFQFGLDLSSDWKNFDIRIFFQGVMKRDYWQGSSYFWGANTDLYWSAYLVQHMDFWRDENSYLVQEGVMDVNRDAYYPRPSFDYGGKYGRNHQRQTRYIQNAAYLRLKNLQLGYSLPKSLTNMMKIEKLRLYFSIENLWMISKLAKMFDPETVDGGNYNTQVDWRTWNNGNAYPLSKQFSCGLSITL